MPYAASINTSAISLVGDVHLSPGNDLQDHLERHPGDFLPVTNLSALWITAITNETHAVQSAFALLNPASILSSRCAEELRPSSPHVLAFALWWGERGRATPCSACPLPRSRKQIVALSRERSNSPGAAHPLPLALKPLCRSPSAWPGDQPRSRLDGYQPVVGEHVFGEDLLADGAVLPRALGESHGHADDREECKPHADERVDATLADAEVGQ